MDPQVLVNGLLLGGLYGLATVGFSLIWGVMNIIDLTQAAYLTLGAYITFWLFHSYNVDPFLSLPVTAVVVFALAYVVQRQLIRRVLRFGFIMSLVLTFGLNLLFENLMLVIWSADYRSVNPSYSGAGVEIGGVSIPYIRLALFLTAVLITVLFTVFLHRTKTGSAIRATALNRTASQLVGVKTDQTYALAYSVAAVAAGTAGSLIAMVYTISPSLGSGFLTKMFVITVLGGFGSVPGAILGGLILGVTEAYTAAAIAPGLTNALSFALLVFILLVRPQGLLGKQFFG